MQRNSSLISVIQQYNRTTNGNTKKLMKTNQYFNNWYIVFDSENLGLIY